MAFAHDPGLSALDVQVLVRPRRRHAVPRGERRRALVSERGMELDALALDSIEIRLDGVRVPGRVERRATEGDAGASVVVAFDRVSGSRLTVRSGVPARLARGHRQLLTVRGSSGALLAERMLDGRDSEVDLSLEAAPLGCRASVLRAGTASHPRPATITFCSSARCCWAFDG